MFTKNNKQDTRSIAPKVPAPPSLLSTDLVITGDLVTDGEIQIDGRIVGDVQAETLIIGETADVNGEVSADTVRVHGKVTGQIRARSVSLAKSAHVQGDILHENLAIEQGAFLEGHCRRIELGTKEREEPINLLVNGVSKSKAEPLLKKTQAEPA